MKPRSRSFSPAPAGAERAAPAARRTQSRVAIPQAVDQFVNATRIARLGIGRMVPRDGIDPQTLRDTVAEITRDSSVAERLTRIAGEVRAGGGAQHSADVVESLLP